MPKRSRFNKRRAVYRVQLTLAAKKRLTTVTDQLGVTQLSLMTRVAEWLASQPDVVQGVVLGLYPESLRKEIARLILKGDFQRTDSADEA